MVLRPIPAYIGDPLIYDRLLANDIFITDNNLLVYNNKKNNEFFRDNTAIQTLDKRSFALANIEELQTYSFNDGGALTIELKDRKENIFKRNI